MRSIKIKIDKRLRAKAEAFADSRTQTDLYEKRGGFKRLDILVGAMGELGAYKYFKKRGFKISKPDFQIYDKKNKSFDSDLQSGKRHFHIKAQSQESIKRYGHSWLMQRYDPVLTKHKYNHYMVPCAVDLENNVIEIFGCISFKAIKEGGHIGECRAPAFRHSKVAIYLDSLLSLSHNQRWRAFNLFKDNSEKKRDRRENRDTLLQQQRMHNEGGLQGS